MSSFLDILNMHDYVKQQYERGEYAEAENEYTHLVRAAEVDEFDSTTLDYRMGLYQAREDYESGKPFKSYNEGMIKFANKVSKGKAEEALEFIKGYNSFKNDHSKI